MRLAREFGWTYPEIDALRWHEAEEIIETLNDEAGEEQPEDAPVEPEHITEEEWQRMTAVYRAGAERMNRRA